VVRTLGSQLCIVCGQDNPCGMRLRFRVDGEGGAEAEWTASAGFQGFAGVVHGGAVLAVLDDAMWYAAYGLGGIALTAEAEVRYRARVEVGRRLRVRGAVLRRRGRLWECEAALWGADGGQRLAEARGKFLAVPAGELDALLGATRVHEVPAAVPEGDVPPP
jgi:acyl-coenzyme A thioesterase PaaI-like protein